ncbi:MAG TPA: ABC transporter permease [Puia sp.]|jgi:putative ABC transport system permease protein|nr:ABC transporter permease [Puia sp.]
MFKNYWKVAVRSLLKRKGYTLINILGLATGMAVCGLIVLFIRSELSYDDFQPNGDRVYRLVLDRKYPGRTTSYAIIPQSIGEAVRREFPEVAAKTEFQDATNNGKLYIKAGDKSFEETHVLLADSNFFQVFPARMLEGDAVTALEKPFTIVLTQQTAKRYFGGAAAAMGKVLEAEGNQHFTVSAVCADLPDNSHMAYDLLVSAASFPQQEPNYIGFSDYTYLLLNKGADPAVLESKLPAIVEKYVSGVISRSFGMTYQQFLAAGNGYHYYLQPLRRIHLTSDLEAELRPNGSMRAVYIFGIIAAFILCIGCINFVNLSTARSIERAKEVGIRKTFGSERRSLVLQFLVESVLVSLLSVLLSFGLMWLLLPLFGQLSGKALSLQPYLEPARLGLLLLLGVIVGLVAGVYPAFVLSSFQPIKVLKGKLRSNRYGAALRNGLVVFQFAISIVLIICTITVNRQMQYMLGDQLGFRKDHIIQIERTDLVGNQTKAFRNQLAGIAGVDMVSGTNNLPGGQLFFGTTFQPYAGHQSVTGRGIIVDDRFAGLLGLEMKEGRFFSRDFPTDSVAIILNESAVAALGLKEPVVGSRLTSPDPFFSAADRSPIVYTVIGVVRNFNYQSLHVAIAPLYFANVTKFGNVTPLTAVRVKGDRFAATLTAIQQTWRQFVPDRPFHYSFLDERLAEQYKSEQTIRRIFTVFSALAILIACIGLLGLAAYATQQRLREISIRKVLGAGVGSIAGMLSVDFLRLVTISAVVAFPIAWMAMHAWLESFVYRVSLSWWIFVLAWALSLAITMLTTGYQAIRAALTNPVQVLRSE